jgi:hypothetical protein
MVINRSMLKTIELEKVLYATDKVELVLVLSVYEGYTKTQYWVKEESPSSGICSISSYVDIFSNLNDALSCFNSKIKGEDLESNNHGQ